MIRGLGGAVGQMSRGATFLAAFMLSSLSPGCDRRDPGNPLGAETGFTIRDSAGVEIVENHFPEHPPERFWGLDMEPEIVLGGGEGSLLAGDSAHLLWRVSGLARLEDGRVAVLSRGNRQLYLFEPTGELSRVMGRRGAGPGEFGGPAELQYLPPDTLAVWDSWFGPVNYFDTDGDLIRTRSVDLGRVMGAASGVTAESPRFPLADGSFVTMSVEDDPTRQFLVGTVFRSPIEFVLVDQEYGARSLGIWKGQELVGMDFGGLVGPGFTHLEAFLAAGSDPPSIHIADGTGDEIRQFSFDGRLVRIIRRRDGSAAGFGRRTPGMGDLSGHPLGHCGRGSHGGVPASDSEAGLPSSRRGPVGRPRGVHMGFRVVCVGGRGTRQMERLQSRGTVARSAPGSNAGSAVH